MRIARLVVVVMVMGCSSEAAGPDPAAQAKCRDLVAAICARVVTCDPSTTAAACVSGVATSLDCGRASGVSSSYDRCVSEISGYDCATLDGGNNLPASCRDVILLAP
ncbi:MAG TPA: hypothetical protein VFQ87_03225 [Bradyrhizobium sp.]|jgi:hypothetical protein|nr:hypothetical protein [Bradyrhizobium sp.]